MASAGLILCGGRGERSAGEDKGLLTIEDETAVELAARLLQPLCDEILISANRNLERYQALQLGRVFTDIREDYAGPLAGIEAAFSYTGMPQIVLLPCDLPLMDPSVPETLEKALSDDESLDVVYAQVAKRHHYLCAALRRSCLVSISAHLDAGRNAVGRCFDSLQRRRIEFPSALAPGFQNFNALQDWDR